MKTILAISLALLTGVPEKDYYRGVVSVASAVSGDVQPKPPTPPGPPTPPDDGDDCIHCDGTGYVGDGTIRLKCIPCDGTGKRKKTNEFSLFQPQPYVRQAFMPARERSTWPLQEEPETSVPPTAPDVLLAQLDSEYGVTQERSVRVVLLSEPSWCRFCVTAEQGLEYLVKVSPTWKVGPGPENHFQVIDTTKGRDQKAKADEYRRKANKWLADNNRFDDQTSAIPVFISLQNEEVTGVHIGWFDGIKPETDEAAWRLASLLGVTKESQRARNAAAKESVAADEPSDKRRDKRREQAELEFVQKAKTPMIDVRALIEKWGPGGKIVLNENATLRPSKDLKFTVEHKGDSTYLNVASGTLSLDYTWGLFSGSLEVPHIRVKDDLSTIYIGLKGPLPDFPIELRW